MLWWVEAKFCAVHDLYFWGVCQKAVHLPQPHISSNVRLLLGAATAISTFSCYFMQANFCQQQFMPRMGDTWTRCSGLRVATDNVVTLSATNPSYWPKVDQGRGPWCIPSLTTTSTDSFKAMARSNSSNNCGPVLYRTLVQPSHWEWSISLKQQSYGFLQVASVYIGPCIHNTCCRITWNFICSNLSNTCNRIIKFIQTCKLQSSKLELTKFSAIVVKHSLWVVQHFHVHTKRQVGKAISI